MLQDRKVSRNLQDGTHEAAADKELLSWGSWFSQGEWERDYGGKTRGQR